MKKDYYIGPGVLKSQLSLRGLDERIYLYQTNLNGWFIDVAKALKDNPGMPGGGPGADPVGLMIAISLFEPLGVLLQGSSAPCDKDGEPKSKENFNYGFSEFLSKTHPRWAEPKRTEVTGMIYRQVRCGLYHLNAAKKGIGYYRGSDEEHLAPSINPKYYRKKLVKITFNVPALVLEVDDYFKQYVNELGKPGSQQRRKFAEGWKIIRKSLKST